MNATVARKAVRPATTAGTPANGEPAAREAVRDAPGSVLGHNSMGRVEVVTRSGRVVSRASAVSGIDQFFIPPDLIPPGWSWEWKNHTVAGQRTPEYDAELAQVGWEPVLAESYDGIFLPAGEKGAIIRKGMILMERPAVLTQEARKEEKRRADERVGTALRKHGKLDTTGTHGVDVNDRRVAAQNYVKRDYESGANLPAGPSYDRMPIE